MASNIPIPDSTDAPCGNNNSLISSERLPPSSSSRLEMNAPSINTVQRQRQPQQPTTLTTDYFYNYELPKNYAPEMDDQVSRLVSLGHADWLPFAERLRGWRKQVKTRVSGSHDNFYYHGNKSFRTFKDVKRYIYLGYPPVKEDGDEPLERWALKQPNLKEEFIARA